MLHILFDGIKSNKVYQKASFNYLCSNNLVTFFCRVWLLFLPIVLKQQLQALAFQRAFWGIACLVLLPSPCNDSACTYHSAIFVKPHQWPTPTESIAIYCVRKLVSCITHLQSCAKVDICKSRLLFQSSCVFFDRIQSSGDHSSAPAPHMGRWHHKCNRLRSLATCSITITKKQNRLRLQSRLHLSWNTLTINETHLHGFM